MRRAATDEWPRPRIVNEYREPVSTIRRTPQHSASVIAVRDLTPRMRRLTVSAPTLRGWCPRPAQDVELLLTDHTGRRVKRRYTIRHARSGIGEFDLDALLHGTAHSPGARWAAHARPGDAIAFAGPRGRLELTDADWHLFVGDESALPAIAELVEALPPEQAAIAVLEVGDASDELPVHRPHGGELETHWIRREGAQPGRPDLLSSGLAGLSPRPGTGHGYLLGESRAVVALRPHLRGLGLADSAMYLKGYWNLGRLVRPLTPMP
jgi:NADPH-dependent ferric siderophore reductase